MKNLIAFVAASIVSTASLADATINGNVAYRYDSAKAGTATAVTRDRIKAEVVLASKPSDNLNVVVGVRTGTYNLAFNDIGNNTNLQSFGINLAYVDFAVTKNVKMTFGKMNQPWSSPSNLLFDRDIRPEGFAASYSNKAGVFGSVSSLTLTEGGAAPDSKVNSVQAGYKRDILGLSLSGAVGVQKYNNVGTQKYNVRQVYLNAGTKLVGQPVNVFVEKLENTEATTGTAATSFGVKFGNASAPKTYDLSIVRQKVEANAQYSLWNDSDFAGGQGNYEGTYVDGNYALAKNVKLTGKYFDSKRGTNKEAYKRVHVDVNFAF